MIGPQSCGLGLVEGPEFLEVKLSSFSKVAFLSNCFSFFLSRFIDTQGKNEAVPLWDDCKASASNYTYPSIDVTAIFFDNRLLSL